MNKRQRKKKLMKSSPYITANKIKPGEIMVCTFAMNNEAYKAGFAMDNVVRFANMYAEILPKDSTLVLLPQWMTLDSLDKESFRMLLDEAEEFYKTL